MDKKTPPPIGKPIIRLNRAMELFFRQTIVQLQNNMLTQNIFPAEVYPGYAQVNEQRRKLGMWHSTGKGYNSFHKKWVKRPEEDDVSLGVQFSYNYYLPFAELGVGKGTRAGKVDRGKKGKYKVRYTRRWDRSEGKSHRPAILMEFRHLETRMRNYIVDYYGGQVFPQMFEDMPTQINLKNILF